MLAENWKDFLKPSKVDYITEKNTSSSARVVIEPLERGFATTIGNALRRVLLSSIYGTAITEVKIDGVIHEQDNITGAKEDVVNIILNIKSIILRSSTASKKKASIDVKGPCVVTADMIDLPQGVEIINPNQVICNLNADAKLKMDLTIESGKGYRDNSVFVNDNKEVGVITIDAIFSPISKVSYKVENSRVGQVVDYDKLILDVESNGSIEPSVAVGIAAKIMKEQMNMFISFDDTVELEAPEEEKKDTLGFDQILLKKVDELELSVRSQNCLKNENIIYIGDLVRRTENDMLRTPNFGRKSLNEIKAILQSVNLNFGLDVTGWPPENIEELIKNIEEN